MTRVQFPDGKLLFVLFCSLDFAFALCFVDIRSLDRRYLNRDRFCLLLDPCTGVYLPSTFKMDSYLKLPCQGPRLNTLGSYCFVDISEGIMCCGTAHLVLAVRYFVEEGDTISQ